MNKKLFITDLDGTLLTKEGNLDVKLASRLNKLIRQGEQITFVTGRDQADALTILETVQLEIPYAVYNGSAIYDPSKKELFALRKSAQKNNGNKRLIKSIQKKYDLYSAKIVELEKLKKKVR